MTLSIELISCAHVPSAAASHTDTKHTHPIQRIHNILQPPMHRIPPLIPPPPAQHVLVHAPVVHQRMLRHLRGVVVQQIPDDLDDPGGGLREERVLPREVLGKTDEAV
jgi:hypothetical protein